jgi:hypothetical protein
MLVQPALRHATNKIDHMLYKNSPTARVGIVILIIAIIRELKTRFSPRLYQEKTIFENLI